MMSFANVVQRLFLPNLIQKHSVFKFYIADCPLSLSTPQLLTSVCVIT